MEKNERIFIEFGEEHYNPLGLIRSLGEENIRPVAIIKKGEFRFASKSRYISKLYLVDSIEEGYNILLKEYGNENIKPVIYTTDDQITSFLDKKYDEIKVIIKESHPIIWRRLRIPANITFNELVAIIEI